MARRRAAAKTTARYQLLEKVATGGMAQLFKARVVGPEGFDKLVAVKRILETYSSDEEFVRMFIDEARLAALLTHPNVVQVFELGRDAEQNLFLAMELVNGVELASLLDRHTARRKRMPEAAALEIMIQVLRGLHHAHCKTDIRGRPLHLVHRDVSPQNILVTTEGVAKLLDFGVAKARGRLTETQAGLVKGKLLYMSPEQSRNKPIDARTDQFAAALVLWECLVGEPCYTFPSEPLLLRAVALGDVRTFEQVGVSVDPELEAAVMAALGHKPDQRFETCEDFANALLRYKQRNYPSYTPTMLGKLVHETCPTEVDAISRVPDLEGPNVVPMEVASVDVSNFGAGPSKWAKLALIAGGALATVGVLGSGVGYYLHATAPPTEVQVTEVHENKVVRTVKLVQYVDREVPKLPVGVDPDAGVTVTEVEFPDGGKRLQAHLPGEQTGWVLALGDGTYVLSLSFADGGRSLTPFALPPPPPSPPPTTVEKVALEDGGTAERAHLPDGGLSWVIPLDDGGLALALDDDGGTLLVPFELPPATEAIAVELVKLEDGGTLERAHLADGGLAWLVGEDGGSALAFELEDGGQLRVPIAAPELESDGGGADAGATDVVAAPDSGGPDGGLPAP